MKYKLLYTVTYLFSKLPFFVLYAIADFCYFLVYKILKYRVKVVRANLKNAFPEADEQKLLTIEKQYYHHLCELLVETFKLLTIPLNQLKQRVTVLHNERCNQFKDDQRQVIFLLGHVGNWEWAIPACSLNIDLPLNVVYHPLSNVAFDQVIAKIRTRFGALITPMQQTGRKMIQLSKTSTATALVADQTPSNQNNTWLDFLNQDTLVYDGPEKLARKFKTRVIYIGIRKVKRGHYEIDPQIITEDASTLQEGEITQRFFEKLEKDIQDQPAYWLWSHRRWKHKREA